MKLYLITLLLFATSWATAQNKIGLFDAHGDIGAVKNHGFASYNTKDQTYTIGGSGTNMWGDHDEFHFLWTTLQGDFILRAEVSFLGSGVNEHRKAGWIIKNDLAGNTPQVNAAVHGDGLTSLQYRKTTDGETDEVKSPDTMPQVIQLERRGGKFIMSTAQFGEELQVVELTDVSLDKEVYVGLYVCSHDPEIVETAIFRNVRIVKPVEEGWTAYKDYIGSHLEVMDVETGSRQILYSSAHSIQAPNWTTDGEDLIYNSKGRLYKYHLEDNSISLLNTGFATNNNNDHVLTFDGQEIGISHHAEENKGASTIYHLPVMGDSTPQRVTKLGLGASYFHGWSPDKKYMLFTGERKGQFDLYKVEVSSGKETQLTNYKTLDDGSEYSPDGKYIFFNSARSGRMQLYRMDADGKNQTQLTFDEYNDWFPHVSPDKKWIVFISFPEDIDPGDHPFYKHCLLRLMPYEGGEPKVIGYIYGGQGTMNVPSWSPDSKKIAFVTNSDF